MNIYDDLKQDHQKVKALLADLSSAETAEERRQLVTEIRDLLVPHSRAEEAVLYNTLREFDQSKEVVAHSYQEHVKAETLLRALQVTETVALNWKTGVDKLREDLEHHIEEEEDKVFSAAKRLLAEEEAVQMGKAFRQLKPEIGAGILSSQVTLMANLMPPRLRDSFSRVLGTLADDNKKAS